jgi:hypothetical protein
MVTGCRYKLDCQALRISNPDPLDLIERQLVSGPVVELGNPRALVRRDLGRLLGVRERFAQNPPKTSARALR